MDSPASPVAAGEPWAVPASLAQERVWLASQVALDSPLYHVLDRFNLFTAIGADGLKDAFAQVVRRHETMRTALRAVDGTLTQIVHPAPCGEPRFVDVRGFDEDAKGKRVEEVIQELVFAPFDLAAAPLWRATAIRTAEAAWFVLFVAHHAVFDAASVFNLYAELTEICAAAEQDRPAELPELPIQYADFAVWQRRHLDGGESAELLEYWRATLAGLPPVHGLPTDRPRPAERTFAGADLTTAIPAEAAAALPGFARRHRATPFMVLLASYAALIHRCSGRDDVVVGVPVAGRDHPELLPLIGMFVNMVVLRVEVSGGMTFGELVERVRTVSLAAWDHQEMPFQQLVEVLAGPREPGVAPLYQLGFNQLSTPGFSSTSVAAEDDLLLEVCNDQVRVEYNTALFDAGTARGLADDYVRMLAAGLADPATTIGRLPMSAKMAARRPTTPAVAAAAPAAPVRPEFVKPRTSAEELVAETWIDVLGVERVGALDDFFDLGGHSLLALRVIARLSTACGVDVPIQSFFADTTAAGVAAALEELLTAELDELSEDEAQRLVGEE